MFGPLYSDKLTMKISNQFVKRILFTLTLLMSTSVFSAEAFERFKKVATKLELRAISDVVMLVSNKERTFQGMIVDIRFLKDKNLSNDLKSSRTLIKNHEVEYALNESYHFKTDSHAYAFFLISPAAGESDALQEREKLLTALRDTEPTLTTGFFHLLQQIGLPSAHAGEELTDLCEPELNPSIQNLVSPLSRLNGPAVACLAAGISDEVDIRRESEVIGYPTAIEMARGCGDGAISAVTSMAMMFAPGRDLRWTKEVGLSQQGLEDLMVTPLIAPIALLNAADRTLSGLVSARDRFANWYMENRNALIRGIANQAELETNKLLCLTKRAQVRLLCEFLTIYVPGTAASRVAVQSVRRSVGRVFGLSKASRAIGRRLTDEELAAIERAHHVGRGQLGTDGGPARVGFYTQAQIAEKARILAAVRTITREERRILMEKGVVGYWGSWLAGFEEVTGNKRVRYYRDRNDRSYKEIQMRDNFGNWRTTYNGRTTGSPDWVD